jgi:hypothetical protein
VSFANKYSVRLFELIRIVPRGLEVDETVPALADEEVDEGLDDGELPTLAVADAEEDDPPLSSEQPLRAAANRPAATTAAVVLVFFVMEHSSGVGPPSPGSTGPAHTWPLGPLDLSPQDRATGRSRPE